MANESINHEHYHDPTAANAVEHTMSADGARKKAFYLYAAIKSVARLAGFVVEGTVIVRDRAGRVYDCARLTNETENTAQQEKKLPAQKS